MTPSEMVFTKLLRVPTKNDITHLNIILPSGFKGEKTPIEVSTIMTGSQRNIFSFGSTDFGNRPTIRPVKTLDCINEEDQEEPEEINECVNPDTEETEECEVSLEP